MTYVMSMFEALPHDLQAFQNVDESGLVETVTLGSPLKNPSSLKSGMLLCTTSYSVKLNFFCTLFMSLIILTLEGIHKRR